MQEANVYAPVLPVPRERAPGQSLMALLALVGAGRMDVESLRTRTNLTSDGIETLMKWLQEESLVVLGSSADSDEPRQSVMLTDRGEAVLISMLERTCELPELR